MSERQPAFVLHAYDWSESSLILDLLTRDEGRQVAVAKGAKRPYSQLRSVLLPFQGVRVQLSRSKPDAGEDEVRTLRSAEWAPGTPVLAGEHLMSAYYLNELLMKFLPRGDAHPALFDGYAQTLAVMAMGSDRATCDVDADSEQRTEMSVGAEGLVAAAFRAFELLLLHEVGLLPDLAQETLTGRALDASKSYALRPEVGLVPVHEGESALTGQQWTALQAALLSGHLKALQAACEAATWESSASSTGRDALRLLLRSLLAYHLDGAPLRTREMMRGLRRLGTARPPAPATEGMTRDTTGNTT